MREFKERITAEEIEALEYASFDGKIKVIDSFGKEFDDAVNYLNRQSVIGFDTETKPCFSPDQPHSKVALLQLSSPQRAYLFRLKIIGGLPKKLADILANPKILKIGAATHDDVRGLQKYNPFKPAGFVDLQKIVCEWGIMDKSVKKMAAIILGVRISKTQQLSNWEADHLSEAQLLYAATDAWVCYMMYMKLMSTAKPVLAEEEIIVEI